MALKERIENRMPNWHLDELESNLYFVGKEDMTEGYNVWIQNGQIILSPLAEIEEGESTREAKRFFDMIAEEAGKARMDTVVLMEQTDWMKPTGTKSKNVYQMFEKVKDNVAYVGGSYWYYYGDEKEGDVFPSKFLLQWDIPNEKMTLKANGASMFVIKNIFEAENLYYVFGRERDKMRKAKEELAKFAQTLQEAEDTGDGYSFSLFKKTYRLFLKKVPLSGKALYHVKITPQGFGEFTFSLSDEEKTEELFVDAFGETIELAMEDAQKKINKFFMQKRMRNMLKGSLDE